MRILSRWPLVALVAVLALGVGVAIAATGGSDGGGPTNGVAPRSDGSTTPSQTVPRAGGEVSGPCDEAEHANDPRCLGPQRAEDDRATTTVRGAGDDISGPCDEAEHANDPRCTGAAVDDDDSGRNRGRGGSGGGGSGRG